MAIGRSSSWLRTWRRRAQVSTGRLVKALKSPHLLMFFWAMLIGLAAGVAAILFRMGVDLVQSLSLGVSGENLLAQAEQLRWWRVILAPALGGLVIGLAVYRFLPGRRPHVVANVIEASALRDGRMSLGLGLKAAAVNAASIGVGASVGREGPVVHLGASLGGWLAGKLNFSRAFSRTLLGCGVAAGVAASFNAPIAGVFFALEVVIGHYALSAFAPVVVAGVAGTTVSRMYYGDFPAFILPDLHGIQSYWEFPAFLLLGIVSGLAAILFMRSIMVTEDVWAKLPQVPRWARPAIAGLALGVLALFFPQILGVGYGATDAALSEQLSLQMLLALIALKTFATALCLGSGFGGGVFSPSLFVGAMVGGAFGIIATAVFPHLSSGHGAYTIVGMGAVAGAVLGAPISTILIVFEMTGDYAITIAVMLATVTASVIAQQIFGRSFFRWQLERRGVFLKEEREAGLLRTRGISGFIDRDIRTVDKGTRMPEVRRALVEASSDLVLVVDEEGALVGTIGYSDLAGIAFETDVDTGLLAIDAARPIPDCLAAADSLEVAVRAFERGGEQHLPVVEDRESMKPVGLAHEHDVMISYSRALQEARREERGEV